MSEVFGSDAYSPKEIAERIENVGVAKARLPTLSTLALAVMAGGFIALGANFFTVVTSDTTLSFAAARVLGGLVFSMGLILVLVAGAELFTGNNLLVMAFMSRRISFGELLRNWGLVFLGNFVGAVGIAALVFLSNQSQMNGEAVGVQMLKIASAKSQIGFSEAFFRGVLCNLLVCLAVWCAAGGRSVVDKAVAVVFPITAFVACGFEHSIANMYFIFLGMLLDPSVSAGGLVQNLVPVTLGNILGGSVMVAVVYAVIYRRGQGTS